MRKLKLSRISTFNWLLLVPLALAGCAGYQVGNQTLYRPDVATIHVPIFQSDSYRKDLGERLTEAVVKEIQLKTPYRVVCASDADSILSGRIINETKTILAEDINDVPRSIGTDLVVRVRWESRSGDLLRENLVALPPVLQITQTSSIVPEGGQSIATAQQRGISQLAEQIVAQMEYPW